MSDIHEVDVEILEEDDTTSDSMELEVVDHDNLPVVSQWIQQWVLLSEMREAGITEWRLARTIWRLLDAKTMSSTGEIIEDNAAQIQAVKLALKVGWMKWMSDGPQIAIFNNIPSANEPLRY